MDCFHETHTRDPADRAHTFRVCLTCGILGVVCDRCSRFSATPPLGYVPDAWCHACNCCQACCTEVDRSLTLDDVVRAIERQVHLIADSWIAEVIRAAATRAAAISTARRECSRGGSSSLGEQISGFRDRVNKGRGLTVQFGHPTGVVTWAAIVEYVRAPAPLAAANVPGQQLSLFG